MDDNISTWNFEVEIVFAYKKYSNNLFLQSTVTFLKDWTIFDKMDQIITPLKR